MIVDASVLVDYLNGLTNPETEWLDLRLDRERLGLTSITIVEVLQGVRDERDASAVESVLDEFELMTVPDPQTAIDAARNYRRLRAAGRTIRNTIDVLIASYCIRHHHSLLHRDRDFDAFEKVLGLTVVRP
ncbi:MAG TPA: PIN domain nuclease [Steroidobacteraceae bacterium]|nr:PIN domain nuclease [Steroidobacteraceae bacterium]